MPAKSKTDDVHGLYADATLSAREAGLRYLPDTKPGIRSLKKKKKTVYVDAKSQPVTDEIILERIRKLVIPPAWTDVWICPSANGHLQVTGRDSKGRKQYIYHLHWQKMRNHTKFGRMAAFGKHLPEIRKIIDSDLRSHGLNRRKVMAIALYLMDHSLIRSGNKYYARSNKSYGLTTLRDKHVKIKGAEIKFGFVGKKGVTHSITIQDKRLARLVKKCRDIPGHDLFQYYDESGERQTLESGDLNQYLKEITQMEFSAKDFRTWGGTVRMVACLEKLLHECPDLENEKTVKEAFKQVAKALGNSPAVCSKYYVHPQVIDLFNEGKLRGYLQKHDAGKPGKYLSDTEKLVIKMLKAMEKR